MNNSYFSIENRKLKSCKIQFEINMSGKTFAEKILNADSGSIVFAEPDIVLTHDNTASIAQTFKKMNADPAAKVHDPDQLMIVLDHNAPPTSAKLATQYQNIRDIVKEYRVDRFHDVGSGICHQLMSYHAQQ
jgi:3-isopropylmalate/(R)-2-methylmalate dehydratase large subunit